MSKPASEIEGILSGLALGGRLASAYLFRFDDYRESSPFLDRLTGDIFGGAYRPEEPDLFDLVLDESKPILVENVRQLLAFLPFKPLMRPLKIVRIRLAERLCFPQPIAANMLLKVLEEPPSATVFLLTCRNREALLPTVLSRCQEFKITKEARVLPGEEEGLENGVLARYLEYLGHDASETTLSELDLSGEELDKFFEYFIKESDLTLGRVNIIADMITRSKAPRILFDLIGLLIRDTMVLRRLESPDQLVAGSALMLKNSLFTKISSRRIYELFFRLQEIKTVFSQRNFNGRLICECYLYSLLAR